MRQIEMTMAEYIDMVTNCGNCDKCLFGEECHLQCTHIDDPDELVYISEPSEDDITYDN